MIAEPEREAERMRIRRADASEAIALTALALQAKQSWGYSQRDIDGWRPLLAISADEVAANPTYVAEVQGAIVGFYSLLPTSKVWELRDLWVSPGRMRRGIGRALLGHAAEVARDGGASCIAIDSDPNAESFYVACGAVRNGALAAPIGGNPGRVRPQLLLDVGNRASLASPGRASGARSARRARRPSNG